MRLVVGLCCYSCWFVGVFRNFGLSRSQCCQRDGGWNGRDCDVMRRRCRKRALVGTFAVAFVVVHGVCVIHVAVDSALLNHGANHLVVMVVRYHCCHDYHGNHE